MFDASEQRSTPSHSTGKGRLILVHWWFDFVVLEDTVDFSDLKKKVSSIENRQRVAIDDALRYRIVGEYR